MYRGTPTKCPECSQVKYSRTIGYYSVEGFEGDPIIEAIEKVENILVGTNVIIEERDICTCSSKDTN